MRPDKTEKKQMAKFQKGISGNPSGRSKDTTSAAKVRKAIEKDSSDIIKAVIAAAKNGDMQAARILIDRICPALKAKDLPVTLSGIKGTLSDQGAAIIQAMSKGTLTPSETSMLLTALSSQAKIVEITELTKRIEALEDANP